MTIIIIDQMFIKIPVKSNAIFVRQHEILSFGKKGKVNINSFIFAI